MTEKQQRWTAKRKAEIILQILKNEESLVEICRKHDLKQSEVREWIDSFLKGGEQRLKTNSKDVQLQYEKEVKEMKAKIGELVLEVDILKKAKALMEDQEETTY